MAEDDWAIVVGINTYPDPDIGNLQGPETDAKKFYAWVTKSEQVPTLTPENHKKNLIPGQKQAKLILSSHFGAPPRAAIDAKPTVEAVYKVFDQLNDIAIQNQ